MSKSCLNISILHYGKPSTPCLWRCGVHIRDMTLLWALPTPIVRLTIGFVWDMSCSIVDCESLILSFKVL